MKIYGNIHEKLWKKVRKFPILKRKQEENQGKTKRSKLVGDF